MARRDGRPTDELLQLYAPEGFLARLAASPRRTQFVLKGGVLLAALGTRRPTRDIDFQAVDLSNDADSILAVVREIAAQNLADGLAFDPVSARAEVIREDEEYAGVRVSMSATLSQARMAFHVDINVGDPVWPAPAQVHVPRLMGGEPIDLPGARYTWSRREDHHCSATRRREHPVARLRRCVDPVWHPPRLG